MAWTAPRTYVAGETLTAAILNAHVRDNLNAAFPVGSLHYFIQAGTSTETTVNGFALECNAVNVTRATYSSLNTLFSGLSFPFGTGNGTTTMGLPDLRARAPHGMASGGHTDMDGLGDSDGQGVTTRTPRHNSSVTDPQHSHTYVSANPGLSWAPGSNAAATALTTTTTAASTGISVGPGGTLLIDKTPWLVAGIWACKY